MQIDFYEEFPSRGNLEKLKLVKWKTRIFVAAKSLKEFQSWEREIKKIKKDADVAYWPIVPNSYYVSPFANPKDLKKLFGELDSIKNPLLVDIELPLPIRRVVSNLFRLKKNKGLIRDFIEKNKSRITTAEAPWIMINKLLRLIGLNYDADYERSIMWYSSMTPNFLNQSMMKSISRIKDKKNYSISLGTIAVGILGNEPILLPEALEKDLEFCKNRGFKKIIIFQLDGLNKDYIEVMKKFIDN